MAYLFEIQPPRNSMDHQKGGLFCALLNSVQDVCRMRAFDPAQANPVFAREVSNCCAGSFVLPAQP